jgi:type VI secretion system protein ImpJ
MTDTHRLPEAIQWHEGMLLAPHHFQQMSIRFDELLHHHMALFAPFHWGIQRLSLDHSLLLDGTFRIQVLEAVMPDGLVVCDLPDTADDLTVDLTPYTEAMKNGPVTIHLAVPEKKIGVDTPAGTLARYRSIEGKPVVDENTGEAELAIPRLVPRVSLIVTDTPPPKYTSFPLAKVVYENETYSLADYIAPTLRVTVRSSIGEMCAATIRRLREKAVFLSERMRSPSTAVKGPLLFTTKSMIQSLVSGLPAMEALLNSGVSHPFPLYMALCNGVGQIAALGRGLMPPVFSPYDHNDLKATFDQTLGFIANMIDEGILESHTPIPFELKGGIFSLTLESSWMTRELIIGIKAREGLSEKNILEWIEDSLIGSESAIESLKEKRILGATRNRIEGDEDLIPVRGVVLFAVDADPEFIEPNAELQIFNITESKMGFRPVEIVLYVKN